MDIELLDERAVAGMLKISIGKLRQDRFHSRGIPFISIGRRRLYSKTDIEAYLKKNRFDPEIKKEDCNDADSANG